MSGAHGGNDGPPARSRAFETLRIGVRDALRAFDPSGEESRIDVETGQASVERWKSVEDVAWFVVLAENAGAAFVACRKEVAQAIAAFVAGEALEESEAEATFRELLNQAFGALSEQTPEYLGRKVEMRQAASAAGPAPSCADAMEFRFELGEKTHSFAVAPDRDWLAALTPRPREESPQGDGAARPENLERLMNVDLDLAISFGETTLPLADVLKLSSGSIVELNRGVSEAVDLLINDSVIARGEVVVVDGNYGVKITEIASPKARMDSLM